MDHGQICAFGRKQPFERLHSIDRDTPRPVEVPSQGSISPAEVLGDLGERHSQSPSLGLQTLGEGLSDRRGVVTKELHHWPELGRNRLRLVLFPICVGFGPDAHLRSGLPLEESQFTVASLMVRFIRST